jgi:hypothetical protein
VVLVSTEETVLYLAWDSQPDDESCESPGELPTLVPYEVSESGASAPLEAEA